MALSNAQRQRRYVARLKEQAKAGSGGDDALKARCTILEKELAAAKARIAKLERELTSEREQREAAEANAAKAAPRDNKDDRIAELEAEIRDLRLHIRFGPKRRAAEPKPEKPPLPPDEERDRIIKGLRTRVRNLTAELHHTREWKEAAKSTGMSFATRSTIMKPLHPDTRRHLTEAELQTALDNACKAFTGWTADLKPRR